MVILMLSGVVGTGIGYLTKPITSRTVNEIINPENRFNREPGDFPAMLRRLIAADKDRRSRLLEESVMRFGRGTREVEILTAVAMQAWVPQDSAAALSDLLPLCTATAPAALPAFYSALAQSTGPTAAALGQLPPGIPGQDCAHALAYHWGLKGSEDALPLAATLPVPLRARFIKSWFHARAMKDYRAAVSLAESLYKDAASQDSRALAVTGSQLGYAAAEPLKALTELAASPAYEEVANTALRSWIHTAPDAAWAWLAEHRNQPRIPLLLLAAVRAELALGVTSSRIKELTTLTGRIVPGGMTPQIAALLLPELAAQDPPQAQRFGTTEASNGTGPDLPVIVQDALNESDKVIAFRWFRDQLERSGRSKAAFDPPAVAPGAFAASSFSARTQAGFPAMPDYLVMVSRWIRENPAEAARQLCSTSTPEAARTAFVQALLDPACGQFTLDEMQRWAQKESTSVKSAIQAAIPVVR